MVNIIEKGGFMDVYTIVGLRPYTFSDQSTHKQVTGVNLYVTVPFSAAEDGGQGVKAERYSVSDRQWSDICQQFGRIPVVGDQVFLLFNRYGRVSGFLSVEAFAASKGL